MTGAPPPPDPAPGIPLGEPTVGSAVRARARLLLVLALAGLQLMPWLGAATGAARCGAAAALPLVVLLALSATLLLARARRGLVVGEASAAGALAAAVAALVASGHPWLEAPDRAATWVPIFGPLALLGLLDAVTRARSDAIRREVAVLRGGAALVAGGALFVGLEVLGAASALWIAGTAWLANAPRTARGARRGLELAALVGAVLLFLAPELSGTTQGPVAESATVWAFLHRLACVALALLGIRGVIWPEGTPAVASPAEA